MYELLLTGILLRTVKGESREMNTEAMRIVEFLVNRGVRANKTNILGSLACLYSVELLLTTTVSDVGDTALYHAMSCSNIAFACFPDFAVSVRVACTNPKVLTIVC